MNYRLDLAYDGTAFAGWAVQPGRRTIQGELEGALERLLGERVTLAVAGRTDAGVHAHAQVASFETDREPPEDDVPGAQLSDGTGPRDPRRRPRTGRLRRPPATPAPAATATGSRRARRRAPSSADARSTGPTAWTALRSTPAPSALHGEHDFTAFTPTETEHVRFRRAVLDAGWSEESERVLRFEIEADSFMRRMVRIIVGTMLEVAGGRRDLDDFVALLDGAPRERAGETAAARGLYLVSVTYGQ